MVSMYCFGGFKMTDIADLEQVSLTTVKRELRFSFAWLRTHLSADRENHLVNQ